MPLPARPAAACSCAAVGRRRERRSPSAHARWRPVRLCAPVRRPRWPPCRPSWQPARRHRMKNVRRMPRPVCTHPPKSSCCVRQMEFKKSRWIPRGRQALAGVCPPPKANAPGRKPRDPQFVRGPDRHPDRHSVRHPIALGRLEQLAWASPPSPRASPAKPEPAPSKRQPAQERPAKANSSPEVVWRVRDLR